MWLLKGDHTKRFKHTFATIALAELLKATCHNLREA
jgi:hypothetical protein